LERRVEGVIGIAELKPLSTGLNVLRAIDNTLGIFSEDHGKATLEMHVDVAVENPRSWVVGDEANYDGRGTSSVNNIPQRWVDEIGRSSGTLDDMEGMTVKMERMFRETGNGDFDTVTTIDSMSILVVGEVSVIPGAVCQDTHECGNRRVGGRGVATSVDEEAPAGIVNTSAKCEIKHFVGTANER